VINPRQQDSAKKGGAGGMEGSIEFDRSLDEVERPEYNIRLHGKVQIAPIQDKKPI